jgi:hypothetical protein
MLAAAVLAFLLFLGGANCLSFLVVGGLCRLRLRRRGWSWSAGQARGKVVEVPSQQLHVHFVAWIRIL